MNKIQPDYYKNETGDLIDEWRERFTEKEFGAVMLAMIEKYLTRYADKNGQEDLNKALEYSKRFSEKRFYENNELNQLVRPLLKNMENIVRNGDKQLIMNTINLIRIG